MESYNLVWYTSMQFCIKKGSWSSLNISQLSLGGLAFLIMQPTYLKTPKAQKKYI